MKYAGHLEASVPVGNDLSVPRNFDTVLGRLAACFTEGSLCMPSNRLVEMAGQQGSMVYNSLDNEAVESDSVIAAMKIASPDILSPIDTRKLPLWTPVTVSTSDLRHTQESGSVATMKPPGDDDNSKGTCRSKWDDDNVKLTSSDVTVRGTIMALPMVAEGVLVDSAQHMRELSVLAAVLQRPPFAYHWMLNYDNLMRSLGENDIVEGLLEELSRMSSCIRDGNLTSRVPVRLALLYTDVLLLYAHHSHQRGEDRWVPSLTQITRILSLSKNWGAQGVAVELHRAAATLVCALLAAGAVIPVAILNSIIQESGTAGSSDFSHLLVFVSLASYSEFGEGTNPKWLSDAFQLACQSTIYDTDLSFLFRRDGVDAPLLAITKSVVGRMYWLLWEKLAGDIWVYFTASSQMCASKCMGMYAYLWERPPMAFITLLQYVNRNLILYLSIAEGGSHNVTRSGNVFEQMNRSSGRDRTDDCDAAKSVNPCHKGSCGDTHDDWPRTTLTFPSAQASALFFLSIFNNSAAALPYWNDSFEGIQANLLLSHKSEGEIRDQETSDRSTKLITADLGGRNGNVSFSDRCGQCLLPIVPRFTGNHVNVLAYSMGMLEWALAHADTAGAQHSVDSLCSRPELQQFIESATALLHSLMTTFPYQIATMKQWCGVDLLSVCSLLCSSHFSTPTSSSYMEAMVCSLLERYFPAMTQPDHLVSQLLSPCLIANIGVLPGTVDTVLLHLYLYTNLYQRGSAARGTAQRLVSLLSDIEPGMVFNSAEGGVCFLFAMHHLRSLLCEDGGNINVAALLQDAGLSNELLISRLCEGLAFVVRAHQEGDICLCGIPMASMIEWCVSLLTEILRCTDAYYVLATTLVPTTKDCNTGHPLPVFVMLLAVVFSEGYPAAVYNAVAELLGMVLQFVQGDLLGMMRSKTLRSVRYRLATAIETLLERFPGVYETGLRLEVLRALGACDFALLAYFTGLEGTALRVGAPIPNLVNVLLSLVKSQTSSHLEQAGAFELLCELHATESIDMSVFRVVSSTTLTERPYEVANMIAAAAEYFNHLIASQIKRELTETANVSAPAQAAACPVGGGGVSDGKVFLAQKQAGSKVVGNSTELIDKILRKGSDLLTSTIAFYERLWKDTYFEDVSQVQVVLPDSVVTSPHTSMSFGAEPLLTARAPSGTLALIPRNEVTVSASAYSNQLSRQLWDHANRTAGGRSLTSRVIRQMHAFRTDALPDVSREEIERYKRAYPLLLGEAYYFCGTGDDGRYNSMASSLEAMGRLCAAMERTLWMSGYDADGTSLFLQRTMLVLEVCLKCTVVIHPSAPLLGQFLWSFLKRCISLAHAAASLAGYSANENIECFISPAMRSLVSAYVDVLEQNAHDVGLVTDGLAVLHVFPVTENVEASAMERVFHLVMHVLVRHDRLPASEVMNRFMDECSFLFHRYSACCPLHVLAVLVPALLQRALFISHFIMAEGMPGIPSRHFSVTLQCLQSTVVHCRDTAVSGFLSKEPVLALVAALGQFKVSGAYDSDAQAHRELAWHSAWVSLLELLLAVLTVGGRSGPYCAESIGWLQAVAFAVCTSPRFLLALSGFSDVPSDERRLFIWEVKEMQCCAQLAAIMATLGHPLSCLVPQVQSCLRSVYRYRALQRCMTSGEKQSTTVQEERESEVTRLHLMRSLLSCLLAQPSHKVSTLKAHTTDDLDEEAALSSLSHTLSFDLLHRIVVQELHLIRRFSPGSTTSPALMPSRGTSRARSPSQSIAGSDTLGDATAEEIGSATGYAHCSLRKEILQLALSLFTLRAEAFTNSTDYDDFGPGKLPSIQYDLRVSSEKLMHALRSLSGDVKRMESPRLIALVEAMTGRLDLVMTTLQS